jgi:lipopolysaccharide transport system ATP-binding protein
MSEIVIRIEGLGKQYPKGLQANVLAERMRQAKRAEWFWALRDVSAEIRRGETIGLVGRNGAGKTTLLRILSRITRPTEGRADIYGRVGVLLEVGTGFHTELTGRENIFLNGALLGFREAQIRRQFAEIVEFSGLAEFIDTPFKRYSSGMKARLGFSVAVHLESDILLIDEALAVGDAGFRHQGMAKIRELIRSDRTVILAGHEPAMITALCDRAMWLEHGCLKAIGEASAIMGRYLESETAGHNGAHQQLQLFD